MLCSLRAELLVLRKSKVAWALVLTAPLLTWMTTYLFQFLTYLGDTPGVYAQQGTPTMALSGLLPSQFVIQAVGEFFFTAPFIVLGAVIAGGDWGHGTIKTAMLAGPSRTRTFAGQVLAVVIACMVSVLLCFAVAGLASTAIHWYAGSSATALAGDTGFPGWGVIGKGVGVGLLIGITYATLGMALGTACRSAVGGLAAALGWYFLVDNELYQLSLSGGPVLEHIYNIFPQASVVTLTSMFGSPGGGASSSTYQPVGHGTAVVILLSYTAALFALTLCVVRRRNVITVSTHFRGPRVDWWRHAWLRLRRARGAGDAQPTEGGCAQRSRGAGVLASLRAELLVMTHWPAMRALIVFTPVITLFNAYLDQYVLYRGGSGSVFGTSPSEVLPTMLPGQFVPAVLNSIGFGPSIPGRSVFFLIGALAAGSIWADGTIKTSLLQAPDRVRTAAGQSLAVAAALVASVVLTFVLAGLATMLVSITAAGSFSPAAGPLPDAGRLAAALGIATLVSLAWGAAGWTMGAVLKSAVGAFAVMLVWTAIVQTQLDTYAPEMPKAARVIYDLLPDGPTNTVALRFGQVDYGGYNGGYGTVAPRLAFGLLAAYAVACFALPVIMTKRRDLA